MPELALMLDNGHVIYDPSWLCVADVMFGFHGWGVHYIYGVIVDAKTLIQVYPPFDLETQGQTSPVLG